MGEEKHFTLISNNNDQQTFEILTKALEFVKLWILI